LQPQALRVHNTRQAFSHATRLLAREMHAPFSQQLWRVLYTLQAFLTIILLPRVSSATCQASKKKKKFFFF
jgi:hypothetical protein